MSITLEDIIAEANSFSTKFGVEPQFFLMDTKSYQELNDSLRPKGSISAESDILKIHYKDDKFFNDYRGSDRK